jgi:hypothetical protein
VPAEQAFTGKTWTVKVTPAAFPVPGPACRDRQAGGWRHRQLIGTRTAGIASRPGTSHLLNDNKTSLGMPKRHVIGANGEVVAGIGVPRTTFAPLTAADLSAGRDPGVDKALELLKA